MEKPVISVLNISKKYTLGSQLKSRQKKGLFSTLTLPLRFFRKNSEKLFENGGTEFWALKDITFDVFHGDKIGIIGRNGAGKSTLLKILSRLVYPTEGEARIRGRVTSLLEVGTGFNGNLTGKENVYLNASLHGLSRAEISRKFDEIVEFSGIGKFIHIPVKNYSSGMHSRLAFSVAAHIDPDILMLDEVLSVGDMAFQQKCLQKVEGLATSGRTILFVSHGMDSVVRFCEKVIWLEEGRIVQFGEAKEVVAAYSRRMLKLRSSYKAPPVLHSPKATLAKDNPEAIAAELISFEISDHEGNPKEIFFRHEPLRLTAKFRVLKENVPLVVNIHMFKDNIHVLSTHSEKFTHLIENAIYSATVIIPPDVLIASEYSFNLRIVTPTRPIQRHVKIENKLTIRVLEEYNPNRIFSGNPLGVICINLPWESQIQKN